MKAGLSRVTSKGQIVIPKWLREKYAIFPATAIRWVEKDDGILMVPESQDPVKEARGMLQGFGILKALVREKKLEKNKENRKIAETNQLCNG